MPTYTFRNKDSGETFDKIMRISERETFLQDNPNLEQVLGATAMGDSVRLGIRTVDNGFKEVLSKISSNTYRSNLHEKLSRR